MFKNIIYCALILLFTACSSTAPLKSFNKTELEAKSILYTKKTDLIINNKHEAIIWITYLNPLNIKSLNEKNENFIISLYFTNKKDQKLMNSEYSLTLNNQNYLSIKPLEKVESLANKLTNKTPWGKQYLVEFKKNEKDEKLTFKISDKNSNSTKLEFEK